MKVQEQILEMVRRPMKDEQVYITEEEFQANITQMLQLLALAKFHGASTL
jgi:hypothetical protein